MFNILKCLQDYKLVLESMPNLKKHLSLSQPEQNAINEESGNSVLTNLTCL